MPYAFHADVTIFRQMRRAVMLYTRWRDGDAAAMPAAVVSHARVSALCC